MPEKKAAIGGQPMAGGLSGAGNHTHPQYSTSVNGAAPEPDELLAELDALAEQAAVEPPTPTKQAPNSEIVEFLLSAGRNDEGNAQCIAKLYAGRFLYSEALGWLHYTGTHWATAGAEAALDRAIVDTLLERIKAAGQKYFQDVVAAEGDQEAIKDAEKERRAIEAACIPNKGRVQGAEYLFKSLVHVSPADFDAEPNLLNCKNGVVDLRTGELMAHDPSQRFMHCTSVDYRPAADPRMWVSWLSCAVNSPELTDWLQLAVGYSLTGHTREEVLFYIFGPPRAGKGVFTETLLALLGSPLAKEINFSTFTAQRTGDSQNFDLAPLKPCRFVAASESNAYERFNEAKVKAITGGNDIYCAFKHKTHFNYRPQFKVWLSSNQPVNADPDDDAVWGRIRLIEFPHSHLDNEDKLLKERLRERAALEGLLAWAVQGAMRWYALSSKGLGESPSGLQLKGRQRETLDAVGMWIEECCELGAHHFTASSTLYRSYEEWCKANGVEQKRNKGFGLALERKGFTAARQRVSGKLTRGFHGLRIL